MYIADASGVCSGEEQEEKEEEAKKEEEESYSDGSSRPGKVVVAVAVRTPPLIALQRSTTRAVPLKRSFLDSSWFSPATPKRQLLYLGYHEGVNPSSH